MAGIKDSQGKSSEGIKSWLRGGATRHSLGAKENEIASTQFDRLRIAILPLSNISPDPSDEYFADGMTEELIATMSKISGLSVIARTSVMRYKKQGERGISEIAKELGVGTILEGSVRKAGDKLRITVQLIDSMKGDHLWSESYNRELKDVFEIQSDISQTVADALRVKLLVAEREQIEREPTQSSEAHANCLKGMYYSINQSDPQTAIEYFDRAIKLDPSYAVAYAWLSDSYSRLVGFGLSSLDEALPKADEAAKKALELDPSLAEAHSALGHIKWISRDRVGSEEELKRSIALNPRVAEAHEAYSIILRCMARFDESLLEATKALDLNPLSRTANRQAMGWLLYDKRDYDKAIEHARKVLSFDPDFTQMHGLIGWCYIQKSMLDEAVSEFQMCVNPSKGKADLYLGDLACAYAKSGRREEALKILNDYLELSKKQFIPAEVFIQIYLALGKKEEALDLLEKAYDDRDFASLDAIKVDPAYDDIRANVRFIGLLKKLGFY